MYIPRSKTAAADSTYGGGGRGGGIPTTFLSYFVRFSVPFWAPNEATNVLYMYIVVLLFAAHEYEQCERVSSTNVIVLHPHTTARCIAKVRLLKRL